MEKPKENLRYGETLRRLVESGDAQRIHDGELSVVVAAEIHGVMKGSISRAMEAWRVQQVVEAERAHWRRGRLVQAMLPVDCLLEFRLLGVDGRVDDPRFVELTDQLVRAFDVFGRWFFELEGKRPIHKGFHLKWIRLILVAWATGGKQMILSPPRHGKSELMIRFVVWMMAMFPNIRIGWFCAGKDIAQLMLGAVKDHLENNEKLVRATLPPGEGYKPERSQNRPWSMKEIKIRQQSMVGQKSSSMIALGVKSKFLSRDLDIIIIDDMEDYDNTRESGSRGYNKNKLAEIGTRKEEWTAEIIIASRQHPEDIPDSVLRLEGTVLAWNVEIDSAHDEACFADPDDYTAHVDCMLFPEVRSYRWLMEKKMEMEQLGLPGMFEMRYLNRPVPTHGQVFILKTIREVALNWSRDVGVDGLGPGRKMAGLDPASRGMQAAFGWHFVTHVPDPQDPLEPVSRLGVRNATLSMIDLETQKGGGFAGALEIMEDWAIRYGILEWYYEDNSQQSEFFRDPRVLTLKKAYGITIQPHTTGKNKQDPNHGLSSMAPWAHDGTWDLPYATPEAKEKVERYLRQLELWTTDGVVRKNKQTDIKMASWFPFPRLVRLRRIESYEERAQRSSEQSYPGVARAGQLPWQTPYPKG